MTRVVILGDSHVPFREDEVPMQVWREVREADLTVHTGDFDSQKAFREFVNESQAMIAVTGNMDPSMIDLEDAELFDLEEVTFFLSHGTDGRQQVREHAEYNDAEVAVYGHSHQVYDEVENGIRMLNPGSCTGAEPAQAVTYMVADVEDGEYEVDVVEVEEPIYEDETAGEGAEEGDAQGDADGHGDEVEEEAVEQETGGSGDDVDG